MSVSAGYTGPARPVRFLERPNRFLARVAGARGRAFLAHVPNPGRMEELLVPGATVGYVVPAGAAGRATHWDLVAVVRSRTLVSVDSRIANRLVGRLLREAPPRGLPRGGWHAEVPWGRHRFDFARRTTARGPWTQLLEVKSSNLRVGRTALFPDAPTERGTQHLETLTRAQRAGVDAHVLFAIQRDDVAEFAPNRELDPAFARALDAAVVAGVSVRAYRLRVAPDSVTWGERVPVRSAASPERIK